MSAELAKMQADMANATNLLSVQHPIEMGGEGDAKEARDALTQTQVMSTSESEVERKANTIDRGDLVQLQHRLKFEYSCSCRLIFLIKRNLCQAQGYRASVCEKSFLIDCSDSVNSST